MRMSARLPIIMLCAGTLLLAACERAPVADAKAAGPKQRPAGEWPFAECKEGGNADQENACALDRLEAAEAQLAAVVAEVRKTTRQEAVDSGFENDSAHSPASFVASFNEAQASWEAYRDRQCEWENAGAVAAGGPGRHVQYMLCSRLLTEARTAVLQRYLGNL